MPSNETGPSLRSQTLPIMQNALLQSGALRLPK
jgi:hypothetical protein